MVERCKGLKPIRTGVVHPCTADALLGAAVDHGLIEEAVLFGPETEIRKVASAAKIDLANYRVVVTSDPEKSAAKAAVMASAGEKGSLHTDQYMHALLSKENKLRTGRLLSHCMLIAAPTYSRRIIISDVAVNTAPDVDQKKDIIQNAIILAQAIGNGPRISTDDSKVSVFVIPTNEELMIAQHTPAISKAHGFM